MTQFVRFLVSHGQSFKAINSEIGCGYIEFLLERIKSPSTVKNYISSLNTIYRRMAVCPGTFINPDVSRALNAVDKSVRHKVSAANLIFVLFLFRHLIQPDICPGVMLLVIIEVFLSQ